MQNPPYLLTPKHLPIMQNLIHIPTWNIDYCLNNDAHTELENPITITFTDGNTEDYYDYISVPANIALLTLEINLTQLESEIDRFIKNNFIGDDTFFDYMPAYFDQIIMLGIYCESLGLIQFQLIKDTLNRAITKFLNSQLEDYEDTWKPYANITQETYDYYKEVLKLFNEAIN